MPQDQWSRTDISSVLLWLWGRQFHQLVVHMHHPCRKSNIQHIFCDSCSLPLFSHGCNLWWLKRTQFIHSKLHMLCDLVPPLKYFTVLTRSSRVASSSHTKTVCGCCWNADTVHMWFTPSSIALYRANALWAPVMRIMTWEKKSNESRVTAPGKQSVINAQLCNTAKCWQKLIIPHKWSVSSFVQIQISNSKTTWHMTDIHLGS